MEKFDGRDLNRKNITCLSQDAVGSQVQRTLNTQYMEVH